MGIAKILPEVFHNLIAKPAVYTERVAAPQGLRGRPVCDYSACISCRMCARDCPAKAIEMVSVDGGKPKPVFYYDRCAFCGQCADSCPKSAISLTGEYLMSSTSRDALVSHRPSPVRSAGGES